jgi:DNA invertase Pin-like site-specific DNA recombinase
MVNGTKLLRVALYARVSTVADQDPAMQLAELRDYANRRGFVIAAEYIHHGFSGSNTVRPQFKALMRDAHLRRFDAVLVFKLDRFSRSLKDLVNSLEELSAYGVAFISLRDNIDMSTPAGKLMLHLIAAFAEFERALTVERVKAGLEHAKSRGQRLGRPKREVDLEQLAALRRSGRSVRAISRELNIGFGTVRKRLLQLSLDEPKSH